MEVKPGSLFEVTGSDGVYMLVIGESNRWSSVPSLYSHDCLMLGREFIRFTSELSEMLRASQYYRRVA